MYHSRIPTMCRSPRTPQMAGNYLIPDGNDEIAAEIPLVVEIIARTCRWVHPETFRQLPVWCPWTARSAGQTSLNCAPSPGAGPDTRDAEQVPPEGATVRSQIRI